MMPELSCPKNPNHTRFSATAHVAESWEVNEHGEFEDCLSGDDIVAGPLFDTSVCLECGADAIVEEN